MDDIAEQINFLQQDTNSINSQIIKIAQLVLSLIANQKISKLQLSSIFNTDTAILQALVRLALPSRAENSNLSTTLK